MIYVLVPIALVVALILARSARTSTDPYLNPQGVAVSAVRTPATATEPVQTLRVMLKTPQPSPIDSARMAQAKIVADQLDIALKANKDGPEYLEKNAALRAAIEEFQRLIGLIIDGRYGPWTAGALMAMINRAPPPPFFYRNERIIHLYKPGG